MKFSTTLFSTLSLLVAATSAYPTAVDDQQYFRRISTFNICEQLDPTCNTDVATNAETVWYYEDKNDNTFRIVYTNSEGENLGFVDISDPTNPKGIGEVPLGGEPTTVRIIGNYGTLLSLFSLLSVSVWDAYSSVRCKKSLSLILYGISYNSFLSLSIFLSAIYLYLLYNSRCGC
jgi:hypothetical protein